MLANVNPYSGALPINPFAREIAAVCDKHEVPHGAPGKLAGFLRALHRNKHLAMDFWSLVVRISEEENSGSVDPDWLLAVIVEGVTGWNVAKIYATDAPDVRHVGELASILAGEDVVPPPLDPDPLIQPDPVLTYDPPPVPDPQLTHDEIRRLVLQPEPATTATVPTLQPLAGDQPSPFSMAGYAETTPRFSISRAAVAGMVLLSIAAAALLLSHRNSTAFTQLSASVHAEYAAALLALKPHPSTQPPAAATPAHSTANPFAIPDPNIPVEDPSAVPPNTAPTQPLAPRKVTPRANTESSPAIVATPEEAATLPTLPEQTMQSHLISSRVPIYPFTADPPGPVVIQAIITARGTVRPVAVISGDPDLRRAALDAVSTWQYRPWMVDGIPTEISTTITVNPPSDRP